MEERLLVKLPELLRARSVAGVCLGVRSAASPSKVLTMDEAFDI